MVKPEDISQEAWGQGMIEARFYADWLHAGNSTGQVSPHAVSALADSFARAIMAAEKRGEEREREACAALADCNCSNPGCDRQEIADAIRNRGAEQ